MTLSENPEEVKPEKRSPRHFYRGLRVRRPLYVLRENRVSIECNRLRREDDIGGLLRSHQLATSLNERQKIFGRSKSTQTLSAFEL